VHDAHFSQPANRVYPPKLTHDKTSAMRNVHVLCSNCPPPEPTQAQSLLTLSNSFVASHSSTMRFRSLIWVPFL